ncbi:Aldo/keto reductase [Schizophyllum commune H4-8]|uniref:NADP-dependent oxidoreductase domain-containing protein n=1 Tax=Schizophyllum commune (strain H4-8 / FGSC 9210) TaxID=578458 RepID=D8QAF1_SCHCM|nr:Aldo/keto reductase [Schizophyllum commune H4-8]KAI5890026.1 Aldo/keto reductase [Schizophyllum commune H4-8]
MSATPVKYVQLGKSGLRVSVPIGGAMSYGNPKWGADPEAGAWVKSAEESLPILKAAWDRGINTFDTANVYSNGESERVLAQFIETYNIPREEIIIATKCHGTVLKGEYANIGEWAVPNLPGLKQYVNQNGLSRAAIFNAVEGSLKRLNTSYVDLYQIHRADPSTPPEETMKALHDLVQSGKVAEKNGWTKFVSMQDEYNLLYREEEREMLAYCEYHGIGVIPWSPLGGGTLARPLNSAETARAKLNSAFAQTDAAEHEIIKRVEEVAKKRGWKMAQVAIAWVQRRVTSPIVGINSINRVDDSVVDGVLTDEEVKYLEEP